MGIYILLFLSLLIIIYLIIKLISVYSSIKEITKNLKRKSNISTNNLITTSTNNKRLNTLVNELNKDLKELRKLELEYKNGNKELQKIITNISHDLRTPLTAVRGYIDLLKKEKDLKKIKEYINIIDKKSEELTILTEQLFDYSRSLDLKDSLVLESICINNLLEELILSYYDLFKSKKIEPIVNICNKKIYKTVDKTLLNRIFENIISNILKYAKGKITISLLESGEIIFINKTNKFDITSVNKIFDRYFTLENGKKSIGVGLSIAKDLTKLLGGEIIATYKEDNLIIKIKLKNDF